MLTVDVLGCSNAWPSPGGATSGYLVRSDRTAVLLDCGHGVLSRLRELVDPQNLDAVWLTHLHPDHSADLSALAHMLSYHPHPRQGHRPRLLVPAGELARLRALGAIWDWPDLFDRAFVCQEVADGGQVTIGDLTCTAASVPHSLPTLAVDVRADRGGRLTYGADCGLNDQLTQLASGTPLLLVEATMPAADADHLSARAAGQIAAAAGTQRCVLVHVCDAFAPGWVIEQAQAEFGGPVTLAAPGMTFTVT